MWIYVTTRIPFLSNPPLTKSSHIQGTFISQLQITHVNAGVCGSDRGFFGKPRNYSRAVWSRLHFAVQHKHPEGVVWVKHPFGLVILWVNCTPEEGHKYSSNTLNSNAPWASCNSLCSCMRAPERTCVYALASLYPTNFLKRCHAGLKLCCSPRARVSIGWVTAHLEVWERSGWLFVVIV